VRRIYRSANLMRARSASAGHANQELAHLLGAGHVGEVAQRVGMDLVGLGQHAHRLCKVSRLARIDARHRDASVLQRAHQAELVAAGGLQDRQIDVGILELRNQLVPSTRVIDHPRLGHAQADIEMLLAHVHASVGPMIAIRYPTLRMHVHD
jgi:hypothetical protein